MLLLGKVLIVAGVGCLLAGCIKAFFIGSLLSSGLFWLSSALLCRNTLLKPRPLGRG